MKPIFFIARRYFFSRKQKTIINVISWISLCGIVVGSMALIIVLSVYNGIGELTQSLFDVFDPELVIEKKEGKTFHLDNQFPLKEIQAIDGVDGVSEIVEENAWATYKQNEQILFLRGVDKDYIYKSGLINNLAEHIFDGRETYDLKIDSQYCALLGRTLYYNLGINYMDMHTPMVVRIPKRGVGMGFTMDDAFNTQYATVSDYFMVQGDIDAKYAVADIGFVRSLLDYSDDEVSFLAISLKQNTSVDKVKSEICNILNDKYIVKDRFEQQPLYYKIYSSERIGVILILSLIIIIASFNLIASLSLLIIDKRKDTYLLQCLGAEKSMLRKIFFTEGVLITIVGVCMGLFLGFVVCFLQQQFGFVPMGDGSNFVTDTFPVAMRVSDFIIVFLLVTAISMISVAFTVKKAKF